MTFDPNAAIDSRHALPSPIAGPTIDKGVRVFRCEGCMCSWTIHEVLAHGKCPSRFCTGTERFRGCSPNLFESLRIWFWSLLHNWRVWGDDAWPKGSYERAKNKYRPERKNRRPSQ